MLDLCYLKSPFFTADEDKKKMVAVPKRKLLPVHKVCKSKKMKAGPSKGIYGIIMQYQYTNIL